MDPRKNTSWSDYWGWVELSGNPGMFDTSGQRVSQPYKLIGLLRLNWREGQFKPLAIVVAVKQTRRR